MTKALHGSARTTAGIRAAIQESRESAQVLARRFGIHRNTVSKWRARRDVQDAPMGPKAPSTAIAAQDEAICASFRLTTRLSLDDCLFVLQQRIPALTRSALHRCFQRYGISRHADLFADADIARKVPGVFLISYSAIRTDEGEIHTLCATDLHTRFFLNRASERNDAAALSAFLETLAAKCPYPVRMLLVSDAGLFAHFGAAAGGLGAACRVLESAAVGRAMTRIRNTFVFDDPKYGSNAEIVAHMRAFANSFYADMRLKALRGRTPQQYLWQLYRARPEWFDREPHTTIWDS